MSGKIERFEDIIAWQKAKEMTILIYREFSDSKDYSFRDQIQRAAISIMNNIAEGFERKTNNEFKHFLYMAKGSCAEVRSMLHVAKELKRLEEKAADKLLSLAVEISRILSGLIKTL